VTRENKLALIVAFALILGVSVLLSDHLSSARTADPGQIRETTRLPDVPVRPIRTLDDARPVTAIPADPLNDDTPPATRLATNQPARGPTMLDSLLDALGNAPGALSPERSRAAGADGEASGDGPVILEQRIARDEPAPRTLPAGRAGAPGAPTATGPVRSHPVRPGESLFVIADRYYGDGNLWRDLARHNQDRVKPDGTVNAGVMLRIPDRADLTGRPAGSPSLPTATPTDPPRAPSTPRQEPPARQRTYTVASGDTLGDISMATLGTSRRWREIYNLNKDRIDDPNNVRAGLVLVLPGS
jgi:nucleoid-associated protein YgaU